MEMDTIVMAPFEVKPTLAERLRSLLVANVVRGIDLNRFRRFDLQDPVKIKQAGYEFVIIEATWGLRQPEAFGYFWPRCLDAGLFLLGYGFFCGNISGEDQADLLLNTVHPMWEAMGYKTPLGGDVERFGGDTSTLAERQENWLDWLDGIRRVVTPIEYSNQPSHEALLGNLPLPADCLGWAAHYADTNLPRLPVGWSRGQTKFHQYGVATKYPWCPPVPGMKDVVDVNKFYGTIEALYTMGGQIPPPYPPPDGGGDTEEEDDMATKAEVIAELQKAIAELETVQGGLASAITKVESLEAGGGTPPAPPPSPYKPFRITAVKALANYSLKTNDAGKPIMAIYEGPTGIRIRYDQNETARVIPVVVTADGGSRWYELAQRGAKGEQLYIEKIRGVLL